MAAGADDDVTKPFAMGELLVWVRAALRRITTDAFTIDLAAKRATTPAGPVRLTPTEWHIVEILVTNGGRLVTKRSLLQQVWGPRYESETNHLRGFPAQSRRKVEPDPAHRRYFITEPGTGYRFEAGDTNGSHDDR